MPLLCLAIFRWDSTHVRGILTPGFARKNVRHQLALEAALMELALQSENQGLSEVGDNVRGALFVIGENAGYIKQGLAKLKGSSSGQAEAISGLQPVIPMRAA